MCFSLEHVNLGPDGDVEELWSSPEQRRGLLPLAAAKWAQSQGSDALERVQRAFFEGRHTEGKKIGRPEVTEEILTQAGVDGAKVVEQLLSDRRWLEAARADHEQADELGVFGVPTLQFPGSAPMFVRVLEPVEGDRAVELFEKVRIAATEPLIHELKRPAYRRRQS